MIRIFLLNKLRFCIYYLFTAPQVNKTYVLVTMRVNAIVTRTYVFFLCVLSCLSVINSYRYFLEIVLKSLYSRPNNLSIRIFLNSSLAVSISEEYRNAFTDQTGSSVYTYPETRSEIGNIHQGVRGFHFSYRYPERVPEVLWHWGLEARMHCLIDGYISLSYRGNAYLALHSSIHDLLHEE